MKQVEIEYLDGTFKVQENEESTLQELTSLLGSEENVIDEVTSNLRYRNKYPRVYKAVSTALEKDFPRKVVKTDTNKDGTVKEVKESYMDHIRAAVTGRKDEQDKPIPDTALADGTAVVGKLFTEIAPAQPLYAAGETRRGGTKISKEAQDLANNIFTEGKEEATAEAIEAFVPGYKVGRDSDGKPTPESLARALQTYQKHAEQEAKKKALAGLAALGQ